jgi:hypothetical protein
MVLRSRGAGYFADVRLTDWRDAVMTGMNGNTAMFVHKKTG